MNIECPECNAKNVIEFGDNIHCHHCRTSLGGYFFKKTKSFVSVTACVVLISGVYSTCKIDDIVFDDRRYPISVEYELINACVNGNRQKLSEYEYNRKTELCACALEKTMNERKYEKLKKSELHFVAHFRKNITICQ